MLIAIVALLLIITLTYDFVLDDDAYKYFNGLGDDISISPDDQQIAFSYYVDGKEAIYTANADGSHVEKVVAFEDKRLHDPKYTADGSKILYKATNSEGIDSLYIVGYDGKGPKRLSGGNLHVEEVVFSPVDETVYYTGMDAKEFKKEPGETTEGFNLFSVKPGEGDEKQLTDKNNSSMGNLIVSPDKKQILFSQYGGGDQAYSIEDKTTKSTIIKGFPDENTTYNPTWTTDQKKMAFTNVSKESMETSLYKYDLYLRDTESGDTKRLTDLNAAIDSPVFFHQEDKIAFLENTSWPNEPNEYLLRTIDFDGDALATIHLEVPNSSGGKWMNKTLSTAVNSYTVAVLYIVLLGLVTVYLQTANKKRIYFPAIISLIIAIIMFASSTVLAAVVDPWIGIGIGMLAVGIFICSFIVLLFAFILRRVVS